MKQIIYKAEMEGITIERAVRDSMFNMVNKHWHSECEIQYILKGCRNFFADNQTWRAEEGCLVIIDSDQIHRTTVDKEFYHDRILLLVEKEKFIETGQALNFDLKQFFEKYRGMLQIPPKDRRYIEGLLTDISTEINRREEGFEIIVQSRMLELWLYIMRFKQNGAKQKTEDSSGARKNQVVYEVANYIKCNYNESKSLEDISNKFYVDKCHLSRIFKSITGFTVNEYINIQRIRHSQLLLEDTLYSVSEIARHIGYDNVTYFTKIFRKYVGTTPLKYRKKRLAYRESLREKGRE